LSHKHAHAKPWAWHPVLLNELLTQDASQCSILPQAAQAAMRVHTLAP